MQHELAPPGGRRVQLDLHLCCATHRRFPYRRGSSRPMSHRAGKGSGALFSPESPAVLVLWSRSLISMQSEPIADGDPLHSPREGRGQDAGARGGRLRPTSWGTPACSRRGDTICVEARSWARPSSKSCQFQGHNPVRAGTLSDARRNALQQT